MNIYNYHQTTGEYIGTANADPDPLNDEGWLIPAFSTHVAPPATEDRQTAVFINDAWVVQSDYRGDVVYSVTDRSELTVSELGEIPNGYAVSVPSGQFDEWDGSQWVTNIAQELEHKKTTKLQIINDAADASLSAILSTYPQSEVVSWDKQEQEARAYLSDTHAATPLLSGIANARGIPLPVLVDKVIEKADAFADISGAVFGRRQALESQVNAAKAVSDVESITW